MLKNLSSSTRLAPACTAPSLTFAVLPKLLRIIPQTFLCLGHVGSRGSRLIGRYVISECRLMKMLVGFVMVFARVDNPGVDCWAACRRAGPCDFCGCGGVCRKGGGMFSSHRCMMNPDGTAFSCTLSLSLEDGSNAAEEFVRAGSRSRRRRG